MKVGDEGNEEKRVFDGVGGERGNKARERVRHGLEGVS